MSATATISAGAGTGPAAAPLARAPGWIVSPRYDLTWFFGGALVSLAVLGLYFGLGMSILVLWWIWTLCFDGPHFAAAYTRTYADREEWRSRGRVLLLSFLAFAVGPICLGLNLATGSNDPFLLFLGVATLYGYYHVVRQHYGFLSLYKATNRDFGKLDFHLDKWVLYITLWAPYGYFLMTHPRARAVMNIPHTGLFATIATAGALAFAALYIGALLAFVGRSFARFGPRAPLNTKVAYVLVTGLLYGAIFFFVSRYEPVYAKSAGPDQDFLLLSILGTIFHNIQYIGLVWFHNRNRYGGAGAAADSAQPPDFGPARWLNQTLPRYLIACGLFSIVYLTFACWTNVFPGCQLFLGARFGPFTASQIGLCLWWGLAFHHYYLDQKIWRLRGDPVLKRNLGLA